MKASNLFYQSRARRPEVDRAEGIYIWGKNGQRYIDGSSGAMVSNIGHSNPNVLAAMKAQMDSATFAYRLHFENAPAEDLATAIADRTPAGLDKVFFVSGGSEAVESCVKFARQWAVADGQASRWKVISRFPSYHGSTLGALAITGYGPLTNAFAPLFKEMPKIPAPTCYLDRDNLSDHDRGLKYAEMLRDEIIAQGPDTVLAFAMEPVGGASIGALVAPDSYYGRVREICDEFGVLLIMDEVMSGVGRTGTFLASEHWNIRPDLVALSKGFGAGYAPLGAMIADKAMVETVLDSGGFAHGHTYAGNPLACSAGLAVLNEIDRLDLMTNARIMGEILMAGLMDLMARHPFIGDVRGKGLLTAFEMVSDRDTMSPLPKDLNAYERFVEICYERNLITYSRRTRGGVEGDHFLICPPLIATEAQINEILNILDDSLRDFARECALEV
ncbi:aspartate aminotransferase family protein [Ruegeria sp. HKCCD5849]|uniref:aminotransferase family protein n=1 Tax=unclassified Ruegeria TaxID=2625375 RepID=UPI0019EC1026|nr:aminotransferase class III-fold pyridoxal phosphate-dependent enzyme [Ruegeria sp. HKCCD5849]NOD51514.1 aminotransferase class III-fold pyridoxal phosphate-dependent enzyme [Ruegeria sp. HKCCD5851]NOD69341.1 aminotransferase class III-fold pyridoxal phosphate-dependent enzyme [Ruegeria sp. HKCCD7303]